MYAQCPECLTVFSLDAASLAQARGWVVCGHCATPFDALDGLAEQLPPEPFELLPAHPASREPPRLEVAVYRPPSEAAPASAAPSSGAPDRTSPAPSFADPSQRRRRSERQWPWAVVCILLALLLGAQLAWAKRDALIADPVVGDWLRRGCDALGCRLPPVQDVRQLRLLARDVQAHPSVPGALMISATVRNDAPFTQPYPVVTLTLTDAAGKRVAMRRLRPAEYLGDEAVLRAGLPPDGEAALLFEVVDPGVKAVAFEFGFE